MSRPLPGETPGPACARRAGASWVAALVIVIAANLGFGALLEYRPPNRAYWLIREKWNLLLADEGHTPAETLILGDSAGNQAVIPPMLAAALGGRALNLCTIATMGLVDDAWMLDEYIERSGAPRRVLVVHSFEVWPRTQTDSLTGFMQEIPLEGRYWEHWIPHMEPPPAQRARDWLGHLLPLYGHNLSAANLIAHPVKVFGQPRFTLSPEGYMPVGLDQARPEIVGRKAHAFARQNNGFSISDQNREALERLRDLADTHDFALYVVVGPVDENVLSDAAGRQYFADQRARLGAFATTSPRMHLLLGEPVTFPSMDMEKIDHVVGDAASVYTRALTRAVLDTER